MAEIQKKAAEERADMFLVARGFAKSRAEAQEAIRAGRVKADGVGVQKPAQILRDGQEIVYSPVHNYVSRGGVKLAAALEHFHLSPEGRVCLDLGASTGGFTDVLLRGGAEHVYAVDVGHGQLHGKFRRDARVTVREGVNSRNLTRAHVPQLVSAITVDVSFIGLQTALPAALELAAPGCWLVGLVKPQFEAGKAEVDKGAGVITDPVIHARVLAEIKEFADGQGGLVWRGDTESPLLGPAGNKEFLILLETKS